MLDQLENLCKNCTLCPLGREKHEIRGEILDPHVFSNMIKSKFVIIAQNPGYYECKSNLPIVGQSGRTLDEELAKHGVTRDLFYITNNVHCHTPKNRPPSTSELKACLPILTMELDYLRPKLVVTLGRQAFKSLCSNEDYRESLGKIIKSRVLGFEINVFPLYHPSGMNLAIPERKDKFETDIAGLCNVIKKELANV